MRFKYVFYYKDEQKKKFYKKLGYNLKEPNFNQELWQMKRFHYYKKKNLFVLSIKLKLLLKRIINKKFFIEDKTKLYSFLGHLDLIYKKIKLYSRKMVWEAIDEKKKLFFMELTLDKINIFIDKMLRNYYYNINVFMKNFKRKIRRQIRRKKKFLDKKTYNLILKHSNNNFFVILTSRRGKVIWYCTAGRVSQFYNIRKKRSHYLVNDMMKKFNYKLRRLNIKYLQIFIRSHISKHIQKVMFFLTNKRIRIRYIMFNKPFPHHFGQRKKKLRRI